LRDEALALGAARSGSGSLLVGSAKDRPDDVGRLLQSAERADDRDFEVVGVGDAGAPDAVLREVLQDHSSGLSCGE
jgi:hypothetical protein